MNNGNIKIGPRLPQAGKDRGKRADEYIKILRSDILILGCQAGL